MSYRLSMPITDVDQSFALVADLEVALASLVQRTQWFLSTRSAVEVAEEYEDLGVYVWLVQDDGGFVAHMELSDPPHARSHYPADAVILPFEGVWKLADVEAAIKSDGWIARLLVAVVRHYLDAFTTGSVH